MPKPPIPRPSPIPPPVVVPPVPPPLKPRHTFNPINYWYVGGDQTQAFSSASGTFVPASDPGLQAFIAAGNTPIGIDTLANLGAVMSNLGIRPNDATVLPGFQAAQLSGIDQAQLKVLFRHENQLRVLNSQAQITVQQFLNFIQGLM